MPTTRENDDMPYCSQCGSENGDNARFCSQCGTPMAPAATAAPADSTATITFGAPPKAVDTDERSSLNPADAAAVAALPDGSALLIVQRGPGAGSRFLLDTDLSTVGRHPESDIFLDDITVSRRHVEFSRDAGRFTVRDVGSLNGTYLNGDRVDEAVLSPGDEVRIGKFRLRFFTGETKAG